MHGSPEILGRPRELSSQLMGVYNRCRSPKGHYLFIGVCDRAAVGQKPRPEQYQQDRVHNQQDRVERCGRQLTVSSMTSTMASLLGAPITLLVATVWTFDGQAAGETIWRRYDQNWVPWVPWRVPAPLVYETVEPGIRRASTRGSRCPQRISGCSGLGSCLDRR